MEDTSQSLAVHAPLESIPPPRRGRTNRYLSLNALQVIELLGLLPLAASVVAFSLLSRRRLPEHTSRIGRPKTYSDASILTIALISRVWRLSYPEVCLWLVNWPALASACGLPSGQVIHSAQLSRRVRALGAYPIWLLYLYLVWRAIRVGLIRGRDVVIDSTLLASWTRLDISAAWSYPSSKGRVFGYKVHTLLDRHARLPIFFLLSSSFIAEPTISVQVMPANVAWKAAKTISGITTPLLKVAALAKVPAALSQMPFMNSRSKPPMN